MSPQTSRASGMAGLVMVTLLIACGRGQDDRPAVGAGSAQATASPDTVATSTRSSADADQEFLRKMSTHHEGLILLAGRAMKRGSGTVRTDAQRLHEKQRREQGHMVQMLRQQLQDTIDLTVMPKHEAMSDSLEQQKGDEYGHGFYQDVIAHHREGIAMIDSFAPRLQNDSVRATATMMRADQEREIPEFTKKAGHS